VKVCRIVRAGLVAAYLVAVALFAVSALGPFGGEGDGLSGVPLVVLGQPWVRFVDLAPEAAWPWLVVLTPLVNVGLLHLSCVAFGRSRGGTGRPNGNA